MMISRRLFFFAPTAIAAVRPAWANQPWVARLLAGRFNGTAYEGGLLIAMQPDWKTYWRVPGAGGIPPDVAATGDNLAAFRLDLPLPQRIAGRDGESIGYKDQVVFPFAATPVDAAKPLALQINAFFGVCDVICIPARFAGKMNFMPSSGASPDTKLLETAKLRIPLRQDGVVTSVTATDHDGKPHLQITLAVTATDIFIEGGNNLYFSAPKWTKPGREALIAVSGNTTLNALKTVKLRITLATAAGGLEQEILVS